MEDAFTQAERERIRFPPLLSTALRQCVASMCSIHFEDVLSLPAAHTKHRAHGSSRTALESTQLTSRTAHRNAGSRGLNTEHKGRAENVTGLPIKMDVVSRPRSR